MRKDQLLKTVYLIEKSAEFRNRFEPLIWITKCQQQFVEVTDSTALREIYSSYSKRPSTQC